MPSASIIAACINTRSIRMQLYGSRYAAVVRYAKVSPPPCSERRVHGRPNRTSTADTHNGTIPLARANESGYTPVLPSSLRIANATKQETAALPKESRRSVSQDQKRRSIISSGRGFCSFAHQQPRSSKCSFHYLPAGHCRLYHPMMFYTYQAGVHHRPESARPVP